MPYNRLIDNRWTFREADTKEFTHSYHAYPAMMIPQVARTLLNEYSPKGKVELLFDPYCGSGTSLVEASIAGINSIGTDLNPLARFMSIVKTTHYDIQTITSQCAELELHFANYHKELVKNKDFSRISNYLFWYSEDVLLKLSYIEELIQDYTANNDFFRLILAEIVRECSYTRNGEFKRFRMSEDKIKTYNPDPFALFLKKYKRNLQGLNAFNSVNKVSNVKVCDFNTSIGVPCEVIKKGDVDIVITSPPYGDSRTTVAYGQFSRWANEWFGFSNAKNLDNELMGGGKCKEMLFSSNELSEVLDSIKSLDEKRYWEVVSFLNDYWSSIKNVAETIRLGGRICYVVGDRRVKGIQIPLDYFTAEMFEKCGFKHINTLVREIPNKRMPSLTSPTNVTGNHVQTMSNEFIVIMEKVR